MVKREKRQKGRRYERKNYNMEEIGEKDDKREEEIPKEV